MSNPIQSLKRNSLSLSVAAALGGLALVSTGAQAATPAAGTNISNVATASYVDSTSTTRTTTSNEVKTTVLQVASFTLTSDQTATANPNGQVSLPHILTNTGNGQDSFKIGLVNVTTGDDYDFGSDFAVYLDANKDGVPDNNTNLIGQDVTLNGGESVGLVVVATTAATAKVGEEGKLTVSATNVYSTTSAGGSNAQKTETNEDTVTIVGGAVISVTKAASVTAVDVTTGVTADRTVKYTLTYKNTGNATATGMTITDDLPAGLTYVAGSAKWSGDSNKLEDGTSETAKGIDYQFVDVGGTTFTGKGKVELTLASVPANSTGTITFEVTVDTNAPAGKITNIAKFDPDGPNGPADPNEPNEPEKPTNPNEVVVKEIYTGVINDSATDKYADADRTATLDDLITAKATQGKPVLFGADSAPAEKIYIHNKGNVAETYNIVVDKSGLPAGSIVELLKSDGNTPLTDTNGDPTVDTGLIPANGSLEITARITLPNGYTGPITAPGLDTILTITPVHAPSATPDTLTLRITDITSAKVDLSNGKGNLDNTDDAGEETGEGPDTTYVVDTVTTKPGVPGTFPIAVTNHGSTPDNWNISSDVPADWTVEYFVSDSSGNCSTTKVVNTGNIKPGQTLYYCAKVTPPAGATPSDSRDIKFTITSQASGLKDSMVDKIVVEAVRNITFSPDRQGQVAPGGTIVYTHTLTNNGNVVEGSGTTNGSTLPFTIAHDPSTSGFITSVYVDLNKNGQPDTNELVTNGDLTALLKATNGADGLDPNESVQIIVKVEAPGNATEGQSDLSIITVTPTGVIETIQAPAAVLVTDKTTVNIGQVRLEKTQALDEACDGTSVGAFGTATLKAKPGQCIVYNIKAINDGKEGVTDVQVTDAVPSYTTLGSTPAPGLDPVSAGSVTNNGGNLESSKFDLAPGASVIMKFSVKVDGK
ncbi:NEW3 domain-containing protein [Acinetobacter chinensis]|uniref:NEW3 domain-containing protein n=1 Tax=Acinetobacter chinensis TaxID=2004650 RepID=A0ABU3WBD4_9GAMM|nr:NEW3 domain-containing protein [Acinetobacter chinensis]MDV2467720.1 NEW3 domain-containing protein [Acinetobacter chinensis]